MAIQGRTDADPALFEGFADEDARVAAEAERAFVTRLDGGCSSPIAAHAIVSADEVELLGLYCDEQTGAAWRGAITGARADAIALAEQLADELKAGKGERV